MPDREEPCPCGSGRKFKRCCGRTPRDPVEVAAEIHAMDASVVEQVARFGGREAASAMEAAFRQLPWRDRESLDANMQIAGPYVLHEVRVGGVTLVERFLEAEGALFEGRRRAWLEANGRAWFSVWEVEEVEPERSIRLHDLLTGEARTVTERSGGHGLRPRHVLLARVVDHAGLSLLVGSHPRPLDPRSAADVVNAARRGLGVGAGNVPPERLRSPFSGTLLRLWEEAVARVDSQPPPTLQNTDGDPLVWTEETFTFESRDRDRLVAALAALEGVDPDEEAAVLTYRWSRPDPTLGPDGRTSLGTLEIAANTLKMVTNSERRADALRAKVEGACPGLLKRRERTRKDMQDFMASSMGRPHAGPDAETDIPPEVQARVVREFKERHYASWPDIGLPALDGLTPRAAAAAGPAERARLDLLLKELESAEAGAPPEQRYDMRRLRRTLGL